MFARKMQSVNDIGIRGIQFPKSNASVFLRISIDTSVQITYTL